MITITFQNNFMITDSYNGECSRNQVHVAAYDSFNQHLDPCFTNSLCHLTTLGGISTSLFSSILCSTKECWTFYPVFTSLFFISIYKLMYMKHVKHVVKSNRACVCMVRWELFKFHLFYNRFFYSFSI